MTGSDPDLEDCLAPEVPSAGRSLTVRQAMRAGAGITGPVTTTANTGDHEHAVIAMVIAVWVILAIAWLGSITVWYASTTATTPDVNDLRQLHS